MNKFNLTLLACAFLTSACLNSPLLNHADAKSPQQGQQSDETTNTDCPIELEQQTLCGKLTWIKEPRSSSERGSFELKFWSRQSSQSTGPYSSPAGDLNVVLWMTSMGHGSAPVKVIEKDDGTYLIDEVLFVMGGEWDILIQVKKNGHITSQSKVGYQARF